MTDTSRFMPIQWKNHALQPRRSNASASKGLTGVASPSVGAAIKNASRQTGAGYDYLVKTAARESSFNPNARAKTSSASGLFQFIKSTWLQVMKEQGPSIGLGHYAKYIEKGSNGAFHVSSPQMRKTILDQRFNPDTASKMAGALAQRNNGILRSELGRAPTNGELYIAHFLGPSGATKLIKAAYKTPHATAATQFPSAARANKPIFYNKQGKARSVVQVYQNLVNRFDQTASPAMVRAASRSFDTRSTQNARPSELIPLEPSKIFQGLFFEAAKAQSNIVAPQIQRANLPDGAALAAHFQQSLPSKDASPTQTPPSASVIDRQQNAQSLYSAKSVQKGNDMPGNFFSLLR